MASSKKTCDKKQRDRRGIKPGDKVVKRDGTGKPQPRRITNADKVKAIQNKVFEESKQFLAFAKVELFADIEQHLQFLCGLGEATPLRESTVLASMVMKAKEENNAPDLSVMDIVDAVQVKAAEKAFYKACKLTPDSEDAYVGNAYSSTTHAVRGRDHIFFSILEKQAEDEAKAEAARRAQSRNRRHHGNHGSRPVQTLANSVGPKLVTAGHTEANRLSVAQIVALATVKTS
jgi:hypothetical protein